MPFPFPNEPTIPEQLTLLAIVPLAMFGDCLGHPLALLEINWGKKWIGGQWGLII
jgi:hypothetical protein